MKRLVWLLILAFGAATSQVQAVDVRLIPPDEKCCCCDEAAGTCGMDDCAAMPATGCAQPVVQLQSPVQAAKRVAPAPHAAPAKFYEQFLPRVTVIPVLPVTADAMASAASVPLFKEHCSFLI
jgi:hypothetical protein